MTQLRLVGDGPDAQPDDPISSALGQTLLVEAGAGTGKTRALVDRVIALVRAGIAIDRIIAITFTERAAAELRDRIRTGLEVEAELTSGGDRDAFEAAQEAIDRAQISTIHAFALTQLRAFAAEAGIDPDFRVLDEVQSQRRLQERRREFLETLGDVPDAIAAFDRALALGLTPGNINELIEKLFMNSDLAPLVSGLQAPDSDWPDITQVAEELAAWSLRAPPGDKLTNAVQDMVSLTRRIRAAPEQPGTIVAQHAHLLGKKYRVGKKEHWAAIADIDVVRSTVAALSQELADALAAARSKALVDVLGYVARFVREDGEVRGREGVLSFDDLIIKLRDLLRDSPSAAPAMRERYDVLMIDEFQDTDPVQVEIALCFARHSETGELESGRVFLVGDPKQSIYRFRRADMAVYAQTRDLIASSGGSFPLLRRNRRSRPVIIDWVNATFAGLIGAGDEPEVQPPYVAIEPARVNPASIAGPGVACFGDEERRKAQDVYRKEARAIASLCQMVLKEGWQVVEDGAARPATLRDIAVLMPTRAILVPLERSLGDAQVPYRVESGSLVYRTQEVRDLLNCLTAIDDPSDEVAIVGGLRSPAFACSDVDLARHRSGGGRWNYLAPGLDDWRGPVADALRVFRDYHRLRRDHSLAALVERFTSARGFAEIDVLDQDSRNSFRRMRFVTEQARKFEESGPESLRSFVSWLEHLATGAVIDQEAAGLEDDEDAVRILTIHAAKGLEFPIVIVAGLGNRPSGRTELFMADVAAGEVAVSVRGQDRNERAFQAGRAEELRETEKRHAIAEANRLLYVAATRARDHLVVSLYHSANSAKGCAAQRLIEHGARDGAVALLVPGSAEFSLAMPFEGLRVEPATIALEEFDERRLALVESARRQRYTSATALAPRPERKERADDETEPWARGRGGTHLGRAVHAAIQSLALDAGVEAVRASSRAQAVAEAIPERAAEVTRLVERALASSAAQRARSAARALREVPFAMSQDGVILEGFIDLVIEADSGIEIVDWKTDDVSEKEIDERLRSYELQAGLYILGLERATGKPVKAVTYVFVRPGIERSPGAPAELRERALSQLAEAAAST